MPRVEPLRRLGKDFVASAVCLFLVSYATGLNSGKIYHTKGFGHMGETISKTSATVLANLGDLLPDLESVYKDIHAHAELSMQETRTAGIAADRLRAAGYEVTPGIGKTGVVGLLRNGEGPAVMLRADM